MRLLDSIEDQMNGVVTYELHDGRRVRLDLLAVRERGAPAILRAMGLGEFLDTGRVGVLQEGIRIGSVPPDFDPMAIKSRSFLYDPRPSDFRRDGKVWIAAGSLGLGDLQAVPGFRPD